MDPTTRLILKLTVYIILVSFWGLSVYWLSITFLCIGSFRLKWWVNFDWEYRSGPRHWRIQRPVFNAFGISYWWVVVEVSRVQLRRGPAKADDRHDLYSSGRMERSLSLCSFLLSQLRTSCGYRAGHAGQTLQSRTVFEYAVLPVDGVMSMGDSRLSA